MLMLAGSPAHCTGHFNPGEEQSRKSFFLAGAISGDVAGRLLLLCALVSCDAAVKHDGRSSIVVCVPGSLATLY